MRPPTSQSRTPLAPRPARVTSEPGERKAVESRWRRTCLGVLSLLLITPAHCRAQIQPGGRLEQPPSRPSISLDFTPMREPVSTYVLVGFDNSIRAVRYARYELRVVALREGHLPDSEGTRLRERYREQGVREALRRRSFSGAGLSGGDQFNLSFAFASGAAEGCFGFVEDAPDAVRRLIGDLLSLAKSPPAATLAAAYVRSEPIEAARLKALRRDESVRFTALRDFPPDVLSAVACAVSRPRDFCPLNQAQFEQLRAKATGGHEYLILENASGHQLNLLHAQ